MLIASSSGSLFMGWRDAGEESDFWHRAKPKCPAFTLASPLSCPLIGKQCSYDSGAADLRHQCRALTPSY
jgi:hypothetical protein